ncbi:tyrosine-type recombinase/integrase [Corynebacterium sp. HMSC059E07]|uniref:tyrosine-type recombinase/integrase n=1 Tax=Corynebacterium sp. HMSC059E07 TaxID=1739471 RepID=UPI001E31ED25|nr:tyrosine-type recombinase/integrase [Corynebacterium sp. HMSC059E07]
MSTAAKTYIEPGKTSIDRNTPRKTPTGWQLDWSVRLHNGRLVPKRSKGKTKGEVRARARRKAEELLATTSTTWTPRTPMTTYINEVTRPKIEESSDLKDLSKRRYLASLNLVAAELKGYSVFDAMQFQVLEETLQAVAKTHPGSVSSARTVLSRYIADALVRAGVIPGNPIRDVKLDIRTQGKDEANGRRTLTYGEYELVIKHLLTRDVTGPLVEPKKGGARQSTINAHARITRLTLLQAVTGLRISEANRLKWGHVEDDGENIIINATRNIVKGRKGKEKGRYIPILRTDVSDYLRQHREDGERYVVGSPTTTARPWDATNADDKVPELYKQIAEETGVEILRDLRSHSWRATLHGVYADVMDARTRADIFGHTEQVADKYYNDRANVEALIRATRQARS